MRDLVIITDLDNTLLDKKTYNFKPAINTIEKIKSSNIPLIFCTSKTFAETLYFQKEMGIKDPFVVENGGAAYIPKEFCIKSVGAPKFEGNFFEISLGTSSEELEEFINNFSSSRKVEIRTFLKMTAKEISEITGLPVNLAILARERDFDIPFIFKGSLEDFGELKKEAEEKGYLIQEGGTFYHLSGLHTKADALSKMFEFLGKRFKEAFKIGLGDSMNDLEMLKWVNYPILVSGRDNPYVSSIKQEIKGIKIYEEQGPKGWNSAILDLLRKEGDKNG